jgi:hypothetical protein
MFVTLDIFTRKVTSCSWIRDMPCFCFHTYTYMGQLDLEGPCRFDIRNEGQETSLDPLHQTSKGWVRGFRTQGKQIFFI